MSTGDESEGLRRRRNQHPPENTGCATPLSEAGLPITQSLLAKVRAQLIEGYGVDLRGLAVWRICIALILLWDVYRRTGVSNNFLEMEAWYGEHGVYPRSLALSRTSKESFSVFMGIASPCGVGLLFLSTGIAAVCLLVGYNTKVANVVAWVLFMGIQRRNPLIHQSGDTVLRHSLFWMIFLPVSERFSIDRQTKPQEPRRNRVLTAAGVGILMQCGALYVFACCHKSYTAYVENQTVVNDILQMEQYARSTDLLPSLLLRFPPLLKFLSCSTFFIELGFGGLMMLPCSQTLRCVAVLLTSSLHVGFMLCVNLGIFPFCSLSLGIPGLPTALWDALFPATSDNSKPPCSPEHTVRLSKTARNLKKTKFWLVEMIGVILIVTMLTSNVMYLRKDGDLFIKNTSGIKIPRALLPLHNALGLKQIWNMFAFKTDAPSLTGRLILGGHLQDGSQLDLQTGSPWKRISGKRWPEDTEATKVFPHFHWRAYMLYLFDGLNDELYVSLMRYLCYKHNVLELSGTEFHNTPAVVNQTLEFIDVWRLVYHVKRARTYVPLNKTMYQKYKSTDRLFSWNCIANRMFDEDIDHITSPDLAPN